MNLPWANVEDMEREILNIDPDAKEVAERNA
jgi:hypothetical protein